MNPNHSIIFFDGQYCLATEKDIARFTPGILKARGVFETLYADTKAVSLLRAHMKRFRAGQNFYKLKPFSDANKIKKIIARLLEFNNLTKARVRVMAFVIRARQYNAILCQAITKSPKLKGVRSKSVAIKSSWPNPKNLKTLQYKIFRATLLKAQAQGFDEAILINKTKNIVEGSRSNIFLVKNNIVLTPPLASGCIRGVMRQDLLRRLKKSSVNIAEKKLRLTDLIQADEAFLTNAVTGVVPLISVDNHTIGPGKPGSLTRWIARRLSKNA